MLVPIVVSVLTALSLSVYKHFVQDRVPLVTQILNVIWLAALVFFASWAAQEAPGLLLGGIGFLVILNLIDGLISTSSRLDAVPARPVVWVEPLADLHRSGWAHLGTWTLRLAGKTPELTVYERPEDGTRFIAIGTAEPGGIVEIESLLDEGRGYLTTLNKRSGTVRPPWMFKQSLPGEPIDELVRAHDGARQYLQVMGATQSRFPEGDPLDAMRTEHRLMRGFFTRRWWLFALRPLVGYLSPSRARHLHEQSDVERQLERYRDSISREPTGPRPTSG